MYPDSKRSKSVMWSPFQYRGSADGLKTPFKAGNKKSIPSTFFYPFICDHLVVSASSPIDNIQPNQRFGNLVIGAGRVPSLIFLSVSIHCFRVHPCAIQGWAGRSGLRVPPSFIPPTFISDTASLPRTFLTFRTPASAVSRLPFALGLEG